jgi:hypothetical protein
MYNERKDFYLPGYDAVQSDEVNRCFAGTYSLHYQGREVNDSAIIACNYRSISVQ